MINMLFGGYSHNKPLLHEDDIKNTIKKKYQLSPEVNHLDSCFLSGHSQYKTFQTYTDNNIIITYMGDIKYCTTPSTTTTVEQFTQLSLEDILDLYQNQGIHFFNRLRGQFVLCLFDKSKQTLYILNDTMATFPIYYSAHEGQLLFSNHLSLLSKTFAHTEYAINHQAIYNYIYFHMIPSPDTIFEGINKLEPNQLLTYHRGELQVSTYVLPVFSENNPDSKDKLAREIFNTLDMSVKECINNSDNTGCFLSGGLDSSAVAGMLAKNTGNKANTFSIGFPVKEYNEIEYARIASKTFNTRQHEYFIQPADIHNVIFDIIHSMDEPFGNSSVIPVYYCAKLAKENNMEHLLAGDGGDEIFAGNTRYSKQQVFEAYFKIPAFFRHKIIEPLSRNSLFTSNFIGRKIKSYVEQANIPLPARLETYNFLHLNSPEDVFHPDFLPKVSQQAPEKLLNKVYNQPENASHLNRMLFLDWKHTLADNDLRKVNTMCELVGIDVTYPMLSPEMIALSTHIPSQLKLTPGKLRYLYKKAMQGFLPEKIINKPKHGFGLPFGVWTKTDKDLQSIAYKSINRLRDYNIFTDQFLDDTIKKHQEVHASFYGELIWILMVLGIWLDKHAVRPSDFNRT